MEKPRIRRLLYLLTVIVLLSSCGMRSGNFNKQKFTKLKQVEHDYAEAEEVAEFNESENQLPFIEENNIGFEIKATEQNEILYTDEISKTDQNQNPIVFWA
ncbi:MAG: hypothetical protein MK078_00145 [Crocinitomicaceae bacterium]|nr:hypothetical protein [Crocinitomicaceae bacterium]